MSLLKLDGTCWIAHKNYTSQRKQRQESDRTQTHREKYPRK